MLGRGSHLGARRSWGQILTALTIATALVGPFAYGQGVDTEQIRRIGSMPMKTGYKLLASDMQLWTVANFGETHEAIGGGRSWRKIAGGQAGEAADVALGFEVDPGRAGLALIGFSGLLLLAPGADGWTRCLEWPTRRDGRGGEVAAAPSALAIRRNSAIALAAADRPGAEGSSELYLAAACGAAWRKAGRVPLGSAVEKLYWTPAGKLLAGHRCQFFLSDIQIAGWTRSTFAPALCAPGIDTEDITGIQFPTRDIGFLATSGGRVFRTENGGLSWRQMNREVPQNGRMVPVFSAGAICFVSPSTGWRVGRESELLKTTDGGERWERVRGFENVGRLAGNEKLGCVVEVNQALFRL